MTDLNTFLNQINDLDNNELQIIAESILAKLKASSAHSSSNAEVPDACRKCGSAKGITKHGKDRKGNQRYRCKSCGAFFSDTSFSTISYSHCDISVWKKYIECLLQGYSLEKCGQICGISTRTAFLWRHKILSTLQQDQTDRILSGIVELDEVFFGLSYKGNHKNSKKFVMPRKPYKRGTDSREQTGSRACVMCALERNGQFYAEVLGKGQPTVPMFRYAFENRIMDDSIVLSDKALGARRYFKKTNNVQHIVLSAVADPTKKFGPPEVRGAFHIQNVNNMHFRLRKFLGQYNGVSTKYLNHYVNLFVWIDNHKKLEDIDYKIELSSNLIKHHTFISSQSILNLPAIPCVA